jgi:hypothetical protein
MLQGRRATATPTWWALKVLLGYRAGNNYRSVAFLVPRIVTCVGSYLVYSKDNPSNWGPYTIIRLLSQICGL